VTTKKEDAILRRIVTDILQFGGVSVVGALPDARPLANELGGGGSAHLSSLVTLLLLIVRFPVAALMARMAKLSLIRSHSL
jgi:hypothetical protein